MIGICYPRASVPQEKPMTILTHYLQAIGAVSSLFAAVLWTASATGRTVGYTWATFNVAVPPENFSANAITYSARASYAAAVTAFMQLFVFLIQN
jgi:hypothetical protein